MKKNNLAREVKKTTKNTEIFTESFKVQSHQNMHKIKHVVILMLENRSTFTNLGDFKNVIGSIHDVHVKFDWINRDLKGKPYYPKIISDPDYRFSKYLDNSCIKSAEAVQKGCSGFVKVLQNDLNDLKESDDSNYSKKVDKIKNDGSRDLNQVLYCFEKGYMPCTHRLAESYVIADQYYASILGPTWSNRIMAVSGQCRDIYETPMTFNQIPFKDLTKQNQTTLFNLLHENLVPFKIYYGDFPLTLLLERNWRPEILEHHCPISEFYMACESDTLPAVSWIEPRYSHQGNSFHPPSSPLNGERLIGRIYNQLRKHLHIWDKCMFVITYDETGGLGDPIVPPIAPEYQHYYDHHAKHSHHSNGICINNNDNNKSNDDTNNFEEISMNCVTCLSMLQSINPDQVLI